MDNQYVCELYFEKNKCSQDELLTFVLRNFSFGFTPNLMSIYVDVDEMYEEVAYDEKFLLSAISKEKNLGIKVIKHIYDENVSNPWFKLTKIEGEFFSLKWNNKNLDFLLHENIEKFFKKRGFTAAYVYDNKDAWEQTRIAKEKNNSNSINYPGQFKYVCGMQFMAAPLMWFGEPFFDIVSKDRLLKFENSYLDEKLPNIIKVILFDLYDSPERNDNRQNQKQFWTFLDLEKVASKYEEENSLDAVQALNFFLRKGKPKR